MLKYLLDLDDPRVGSSQKPEILADDPFTLKQGAEKSWRAYDKIIRACVAPYSYQQ